MAEPPDAADEGVAALFAGHRRKLFRLAVLLVGDESTAEDMVQDAFMGLHRKWPDLRDEAAVLGGWPHDFAW